MIKLYLDCDGVIIDSITTTYELIRKEHIDLKNENEVRKFYEKLDWNHLLKTSKIINNALTNIQEIINSNLYDVSILTHVVSENEANAKLEWFKKKLPNVKVIPTKKEIEKCDMVDPTDAVLVDDYTGNLDLWYEKGGLSVKFADNNKSCSYPKINNLNKLMDLYPTFEKIIKEKNKQD